MLMWHTVVLCHENRCLATLRVESDQCGEFPIQHWSVMALIQL